MSPPIESDEHESPGGPEGEPVPCVTLYDVGLLPLIKSLLDAAGIRYFVKHETIQNFLSWGAIFGFNPVAGPPVVMVEASREDEARELLRPILERSVPGEPDAAQVIAPDGPRPETCPRCEKQLEPGDDEEPLTHCYHCGSPI